MKKSIKKIGIFGSIEYDDMGDDALLLSNVEYFKKRGYELVIFTSNVPKTIDLLIREKLIPDSGIFNQISVVESLDVFLSRPSNIFKYIDFLIDTVSDKLFRSRFGIFNSLYLLFLKNNLLNICKKDNNKKSQPSIFINNLRGCSLVFFMGGGYFNKHWGYKINQFFLTIDLALFLKKPVIASGQTFGPLNIIQKAFFKKRINYFKYFLVRDINRSKNRLIELGFDFEKIIEGPDDAIFLENNPTHEFIIPESFFKIVINLGGFVRYSKRPLTFIYQEIARFLDRLIETKNARIIYISMDRSSSDYSRGMQIQKYMKFPEKMCFIPLNTSPKIIKSIIGKSNLVLSSRLHPMVFAISEKIPFIGISSGGEYYDSKLGGLTESYGYDFNKHIIDIDEVSLERLGDYLECAINDSPNDIIYQENEKKRMKFLKIIHSFLS